MVGEPEKSVAVALAGAVAVLTKTIFSNNAQWPEIFNVLLQLSQDPNEKMRALNYELLGQVTAASQLCLLFLIKMCSDTDSMYILSTLTFRVVAYFNTMTTYVSMYASIRLDASMFACMHEVCYRL